jgi:hypothetical protein
VPTPAESVDDVVRPHAQNVKFKSGKGLTMGEKDGVVSSPLSFIHFVKIKTPGRAQRFCQTQTKRNWAYRLHFQSV